MISTQHANTMSSYLRLRYSTERMSALEFEVVTLLWTHSRRGASHLRVLRAAHRSLLS